LLKVQTARLHNCPSLTENSRSGAQGNDLRRDTRFRAPVDSLSRKISFGPKGRVTPWLMLTLGGYFLPVLCDSGSSMSFLRRDVFEKVKQLGITYSVVSEQETCVMADGQAYNLRESVLLSIKIRTGRPLCRID
jgi:hypothetical protein